ncbi:hypothetical protein ON010_g9593 [Phytophthora cinnamomi]|nr:hypothetical protein ON010_g9593 [Phytophthora cinnamomi]
MRVPVAASTAAPQFRSSKDVEGLEAGLRGKNLSSAAPASSDLRYQDDVPGPIVYPVWLVHVDLAPNDVHDLVVLGLRRLVLVGGVHVAGAALRPEAALARTAVRTHVSVRLHRLVERRLLFGLSIRDGQQQRQHKETVCTYRQSWNTALVQHRDGAAAHDQDREQHHDQGGRHDLGALLAGEGFGQRKCHGTSHSAVPDHVLLIHGDFGGVLAQVQNVGKRVYGAPSGQQTEERHPEDEPEPHLRYNERQVGEHDVHAHFVQQVAPQVAVLEQQRRDHAKNDPDHRGARQHQAELENGKEHGLELVGVADEARECLEQANSHGVIQRAFAEHKIEERRVDVELLEHCQNRDGIGRRDQRPKGETLRHGQPHDPTEPPDRVDAEARDDTHHQRAQDGEDQDRRDVFKEVAALHGVARVEDDWGQHAHEEEVGVEVHELHGDGAGLHEHAEDAG